MAAIAAHPGAFHAASSDADGAVAGITSMELSVSGELVDVTDFADTSGYHVKLQALKDATVSVSGNFEYADAAQVLIRTSFASGATIYLKVLPDGTNGYKGTFKVSDYKVTAEVAGLVAFSATFQATGALSAAP